MSLGTGAHASIPPQIPHAFPNFPSARCRGPEELTPARKTKGEPPGSPETLPRSGRERRGAPAWHPGCSPHLANDVSKSACPRQCPLGVGQLQGRGPAKRMGHPGTSWLLRGDRGTPRFPRGSVEPEFSHPTLNWEPGTLNWPAEEFTLGIRNPIALVGLPHQGTHWPKGETGGERDDLFQLP